MALRLRADKALGRLQPAMRERVLKGLSELAKDPYRARPGADIKPLRPDLGMYRLRVGEYRAFYVVDGETVYVTDLLHRSHAYD